MAKIIKLDKNEEIAQVIQRIKKLREQEAILEVEKGASILANSQNLRLIRKTAEVLGKHVSLKTDDEMGQVLATKAGMDLYGDKPVKIPRSIRPSRVPKGKFSDIKNSRAKTTVPEEDEMEAAPVAVAKEDDTEEWEEIEVPKPSVKTKRQFSPASSAALSQPFPTMPPARMGQSAKPRPEPVTKSGSRFWKHEYSKIFVLVAVILIVAVFGLSVLLPKADIIVYARSEPITRDLEINVDKGTTEIDVARQTIPGEMIVKELSHTKNFQTTGQKKVGEKATGSVVIYNFTKNTLTLRAATTTLIINGKKYFFTKDATGIRPTATIGQGEEQEVDRSSLTAPVPIIAESAGEEYNLAVNQKITLQNTALGDNQNVYAMNETPFTGGSAKIIPILAQADLDRATTQMTEELALLAEEELEKESSDSAQKVLPTGSNKEVLAKTANKNVGDEGADFDMTIIGRLTGLSYNENDVKNLVTEKIASVLTPDKYLLEDGRKDVTARFKSLDLATGKGILTIHFETVVAYKVDSENMTKVLAGKDALEIKEILLTKPEIDRVDVKFSPFFVNKAPRFNGKIFIETKLSQT